MTVEEAEHILGPELAAHIRSQPCKPLTPEQLNLLVGIFTRATASATDAA